MTIEEYRAWRDMRDCQRSQPSHFSGQIKLETEEVIAAARVVMKRIMSGNKNNCVKQANRRMFNALKRLDIAKAKLKAACLEKKLNNYDY